MDLWNWGRPRRNLPEVNYAENSSTDEEDLETGLNFESPLNSPRRPLPTRQGSPSGIVEGGPTLADNVDDTLEEVQWKLHDIAVVREEVEEVTDLLESADTKVGEDPLKDDTFGEIVEESGYVVGTAHQGDCEVGPSHNSEEEDSEGEEVDIMADFDTINGEDAEKAAEKLGTLQCPYDKDDLDYWFSELEGQLEVIGVQSQWTKRICI